jgi:hypothetical protein
MPERETTPHRSHLFDVGDLYGDNFSHGIILSMYLDGMTNCWNKIIKGLRLRLRSGASYMSVL